MRRDIWEDLEGEKEREKCYNCINLRNKSIEGGCSCHSRGIFLSNKGQMIKERKLVFGGLTINVGNMELADNTQRTMEK